jgi:hypothetical protein
MLLMLWRLRTSRGRPMNAPAAFIHPCRPTVVAEPPSGSGWAHETSGTTLLSAGLVDM